MTCYYRNEEATKEVLKDGWLYTGDMAMQDEDGFYFLVDRKKDVIVSGGENIYPVQIEDFIRRFNKVKDVNVSTVSKAFKQCELKGLLTSTIGSGTFVSYDATTNSYIMPGKKDLEMIEMASIFPDMGANEEIVEKLKEISFEPDVGNLFTYAKPGGEIDLCGHATLACAYVVMNYYMQLLQKIIKHTIRY